MTTDRNSEGATSVMYGRMLEANFPEDTLTFVMQPGYYAAAGEYLIAPVKDFTPPASIPAAEVQALVERLRVSARENQDTAYELPDDLAEARWHEGIAYAKNEDADELAKLIPRGT